MAGAGAAPARPWIETGARTVAGQPKRKGLARVARGGRVLEHPRDEVLPPRLVAVDIGDAEHERSRDGCRAERRIAECVNAERKQLIGPLSL